MHRMILLLALSGCWLAGAESATPLRLPPILCCAQDFTRRVVVDVEAVTGITVRTNPEQRFAATVRVLTLRQVEIQLRALASGHGTLELLGSDQAVLGRCALQEVSIISNASDYIGCLDQRPDGSKVFGGELIMRPYVPGLDVRFICLSRQVAVTDGLNERWMASESFTPTPSTGNGITSFRMVQAPKAEWVPYTYVLYQNGEQISAP